MRPTAQQHQRAPDGAPVHYERHRPAQTTLYYLLQQHAASFVAHTEASTGAELPRFIKDEFNAFLDCGILASSCGCVSNHIGPWWKGQGIDPDSASTTWPRRSLP